MAAPGDFAPTLNALRAGFDATTTDPDFLADGRRPDLEVRPVSGVKADALIRARERPAAAGCGQHQVVHAEADRRSHNPPDWFPDGHPPLPHVVAHGGASGVRACIGCHLPTGLGHPENSRIPGATAAYLLRQLADFRSGARKGEAGGAMISIAKGLTEDEMKDAIGYFSSLKPARWTRVVETDTVPKSYFKGTARLPHPDGGTEPIGNRIIELPEDLARFEMRDPHSGFVSYVPVVALSKGEALVTTGGGGTTIPCAICHGPDLKGLGRRAGHRRTVAWNHRAPALLYSDRRSRGALRGLDEGRGTKINR